MGLVATFEALMLIDGLVLMHLPEQVGWRRSLLIFYGIAMALCGLAAGIVGLVAFKRQNERSWLVWLPVLAGLFIIIFLLGEFVSPH